MHDHTHQSQDQSPDGLNQRRAMLAGIGGLAAGALLAGKAHAGPLNPPPGPIAPTPGPEPRIPINQTNTPGTASALFRITQGGSYYLTQNVSVPSGLVGIEITNSDVTIDLNGFAIAGLVNTSSDGIAVQSVVSRSNITIRNGTIVTCGGSGVNLTNGTNSVVEAVHVRGCTTDGIRTGDNSRVIGCATRDNGGKGILTGQNAIVRYCTAQGSGGTGIEVGINTIIQSCTASGNSSHGFNISSGCTLNACTARSNTGTGIRGGIGISLNDCTAIANSAGGIDTDVYCTLSHSSASNNTGIGIRTGTGAVLSNCTASGNTLSGFSTGSKGTITHCAAYNNQGDGIQSSQNSTIAHCSSNDNSGHGISASNGCSILDCTATFNTLDGIRFANECLIRGNNSTYAGRLTGDGAAIHATGQLNRIEANHASRSDRGIQADGQGNIIVRNTCTSNSGGNFVIAANNVYGPILNRTAPASAAVNGNSATSTLGSTDANANYAH